MVKDDALLWNLRRWGAPLAASGGPGRRLGLEETLARGLALSRRSPTVAQTWPVVFAKHRDEVDLPKLESMARRMGQGRALGFFLCVLGRLLPDASLLDAAERPGLKRPMPMRYFFTLGRDAMYRRLTRMRTPDLARERGFWMNTALEDFRSCLLKFCTVHATVL